MIRLSFLLLTLIKIDFGAFDEWAFNKSFIAGGKPSLNLSLNSLLNESLSSSSSFNFIANGFSVKICLLFLIDFIIKLECRLCLVAINIVFILSSVISSNESFVKYLKPNFLPTKAEEFPLPVTKPTKLHLSLKLGNKNACAKDPAPTT